MRILISCIPFDRGKSGISVYIRSIIAALAEEGHELTLLIEPGDAVFFPGFQLIEMPRWTRQAPISFVWHLLAVPVLIWRRRRYDFCIIAAANRRAFAFYPLFTVAVVHDLAQYHVAGKYDRFRMFYLKRVLPIFVRRAPAVLAISDSTAHDLKNHWRVPEKKIRMVYNGLSIPAENNPNHDWITRNRLDGTPYILYISRIESPGKNHLNLIRAFELLSENLASRVRLVCAGADWHGAADVHTAASRSPRAERILFPGYLAAGDLADAYRHAECYVFPSFFEGFGLSLIEAMHHGVPCCCSHNSSLGEIGKGAALLFDPESPEEIAAALTEILSSEETRHRLAVAGKERAKQFNWGRHARAIVDWYREDTARNANTVLLGIPVKRARTKDMLDLVIAQGKDRARSGCRILVTLNVDFIVNAIGTWFHRAVPGLLPVLRDADFCCADGMPLVLLSRLLGCPLPERIAGADLVPMLAERAAKEGQSIYLLGGSPENTLRTKEILEERNPSLRIAGLDTSFVSLADSEESRRTDQAICDRINAVRPDLLLVAFGNPKQELWLAKNVSRLDAGVAIGIGGSFNFLAGAVRRAPRWMQRLGLEWIYRVAQEPSRLWKRYALGLLKFGWLGGWEILAAGLCALLLNRRSLSFQYENGGHEVIVDCTGVFRLGNPERLIMLAAIREAGRNACPLRRKGGGILLRFQLWAHRLYF